ncbi:MAG: NAD-dependent epimerase/dehydratase family protein [Rhodocyclaceae bacterium]|nr:MAG: NAD-dependent epimerase/dehydratase family protein [Rhodocyclaceae bacterium]
MRILVLGGTAWLGRHLVEAARAKGHDVACLARGTSAMAPRGAKLVRADRDLPNAYDQVLDQRWDSVIDVARQPGQVRSAASALAKSAHTYVFISSASVYADHAKPRQDESAALLPPLQADVMEDMNSYGQAKVACEQHVLAAFGEERSLIVRAGLIGGPGDESDRTGYWPLRFAKAAGSGCRVLIPDAPGLSTQVIDVRDLARWVVDRACAGDAGAFNATGETIGFQEHLDLARHVGGHRGRVVTAGSEWLAMQGVTPWMGEKSLPLWLPMPEYAGFSTRDSSAAVKAGLSRRSLEATLRDTLEWELSRAPAPATRRAGLSDADEAFLLGILGA